MSRTGKVILVILGTLAVAGFTIGYIIWEDRAWNVLWEAKAEGTAGMEAGASAPRQLFEIPLSASHKERVLKVEPHPESGWGYPDFNIAVWLFDPDENVVAEIPKDQVYSAGVHGPTVFERPSQSRYAESVRFNVRKDGIYTLIVTPLTLHIDHIRLVIREKK